MRGCVAIIDSVDTNEHLNLNFVFGDSIHIDTIDIDTKPIDGVRSMGDAYFSTDFYTFECHH